MAEYIDRKGLLDELCRDNCERTYDGTCNNCRMTDTIADFPAADVAEVRHGKWIEYKIPHIICCSVCDWGTGIDQKTSYCPNCGALMKEDGHEAG